MTLSISLTFISGCTAVSDFKKIVGKFLGILLGAFFSLLVNAQEINGIGDFKVGMTEIEFLALPEILSKNVQDASKKKLITNDRDVWRKTNESPVPDSYSRMPSIWRIYTPEYVKYEFKISVGIKNSMGTDTYDATAEFYKGELIEIALNPAGALSQFRDVLAEKYGKPSINDNMKKEICQNGYGAKSEHNDGFMSWNWGGKGGNVATLTISSSNCGKNAHSFYSVTNRKKSSYVMDLERKARKVEEKEETKSKASSTKL